MWLAGKKSTISSFLLNVSMATMVVSNSQAISTKPLQLTAKEYCKQQKPNEMNWQQTSLGCGLCVSVRSHHYTMQVPLHSSLPIMVKESGAYQSS